MSHVYNSYPFDLSGSENILHICLPQIGKMQIEGFIYPEF